MTGQGRESQTHNLESTLEIGPRQMHATLSPAVPHTHSSQNTVLFLLLSEISVPISAESVAYPTPSLGEASFPTESSGKLLTRSQNKDDTDRFLRTCYFGTLDKHLLVQALTRRGPPQVTPNLLVLGETSILPPLANGPVI